MILSKNDENERFFIQFLFSFPGQKTNDIFLFKKAKITNIGKKLRKSLSYFDKLPILSYFTYVTPGNDLLQ